MKDNIKTILLFIATAGAGFFAMAVPFRLFSNLTQTEMRIVLAVELAVCFAIFCAVFLKKEARENKRQKEEKAMDKHRKRVENRNEMLNGIKVYNYDIAA